MTNALSEAPEVSTVPVPEKAAIKVEPFGQGMLTLHWDDVIEALRASGYDDIAIANLSGALRAQRLIAWGLWIDGKIHAIAVTGDAYNEFTKRMSCAIYAFHGDAEMDQWQEALSQMCAVLKGVGYASVYALTDLPRVTAICEQAGWQMKHLCMKDI